jgi:putative transcriptional regulator
VFAEPLASAKEALAHAKGKRELRTTVLPRSPQPMRAREIRVLRRKMNASQAVFAHYMNVSTKLVQAWEAERRSPDGPALLLLRLAQANPALLLVSSHEAEDAA